MILVLEEIVHPKAEIVQIELAKVFARNSERIKIVLLEIAPKFSAAFFVFSPNETGSEKNDRGDNRRDHVDSDLALQCVNHAMSSIERSTTFAKATAGRQSSQISSRV